MDEELYPGERDLLGSLVYHESRRIILEDPEASHDARQVALWAIPWEAADASMKADCIRTAWAVRQKVLEDHGGVLTKKEIP